MSIRANVTPSTASGVVGSQPCSTSRRAKASVACRMVSPEQTYRAAPMLAIAVGFPLASMPTVCWGLY
jgi:hypothetical protein